MHGDGYGTILTSWAYKTIMTLVGRLSEKNVLVGLAIYEYTGLELRLRQEAVKCDNENPDRAFKNLMKN